MHSVSTETAAVPAGLDGLECHRSIGIGNLLAAHESLPGCISTVYRNRYLRRQRAKQRIPLTLTPTSRSPCQIGTTELFVDEVWLGSMKVKLIHGPWMCTPRGCARSWTIRKAHGASRRFAARDTSSPRNANCCFHGTLEAGTFPLCAGN